MSTHIGRANGSEQLVYEQAKFIREQENIATPFTYFKMRCPCLKLIRFRDAYKCLYCGVYFCEQCAEEHFGKTKAEYREQNQ